MSAQALIRQVTGLNVSPAQAERAIRVRMDCTGETSREQYLSALSPREWDELVELLVVPESWMFRDPEAFKVAVRHVQARLARDARPLRILSLPCAGGEEPYTIAMALFDAGVPAHGFAVDAIDISAACVARARAGVYGRNAFRNKDLAFRDRYFSVVGDDAYRINNAVRAQVHIRQGNLLSMDTAPLARCYELIFCRNLLIYFDKPTTALAIARLADMLDDDGLLFAGYAEVPSFTQEGFTPLPHRYAFALKKDLAPAPRYASLPQPAAPLHAARPPLPAWAPSDFPRGPRVPAGGIAGQADTALPPRGAAPMAPLAPAPETAAKAATRFSANRAPTGAAPVAAAAPDTGIAGARALADRGALAQAEAACHAVLAAEPHTPAAAEAYYILGMLRDQARDQKEAELFWRRCIYLQPDHYAALCHLALLAEQQGDLDGAARLKARARRIYERGNAAGLNAAGLDAPGFNASEINTSGFKT